MDFNSSPMNINLLPEDTFTMVTIPVTCDKVVEGPEMFNITLSIISVSDNITVELDRNRSVGVIEDSTG